MKLIKGKTTTKKTLDIKDVKLYNKKTYSIEEPIEYEIKGVISNNLRKLNKEINQIKNQKKVDDF